MRRIRVRFAALALTTLLVGVGLWQWSDRRTSASEYITAPVTRGDIEDTVTALGTVKPPQSSAVDVGAQVSGRLQRLYVQIGRKVRQGDLLAEIDPTLFEAHVAESRATLQNFQAQLQQKKAELTLAQRQNERSETLYQRQLISLDTAQSSQSQYQVADAAVESLTAQIAQAEATLHADEANLAYTKIYAPRGGTVVDVVAHEGQTLNANQQAPLILRLADVDTMVVWAQVSEVDVQRIRVGTPVYFTTLGQSRRWDSLLDEILPTPENVNGVVFYDALFRVPNSDHVLKISMTAQVYFVLAAAHDALLIPVAALVPNGGARTGGGGGRGGGGGGGGRRGNGTSQGGSAGASAVRVLNNGAPENRMIRVGVRNRVSAEVLSGLSDGEAIITGVKVPGTVGPGQGRGQGQGGGGGGGGGRGQS